MKTVQMEYERERERALDPSKMLCVSLPRHRVQMLGQLPTGHLHHLIIP